MISSEPPQAPRFHDIMRDWKGKIQYNIEVGLETHTGYLGVARGCHEKSTIGCQ